MRNIFIIAIAILFSHSINAQVVLKSAVLKSAQIALTNSSGGGGFSIIASTGQVSAGGDTTTPGINTTGANGLCVAFDYGGLSEPTIIDTYGNTWTSSANYTAANPRVRFFYSLSATVGTGHTVTIQSVGGTTSNVRFIAFSKSGGSPSFDAEAAGGHTANWFLTSLQPGSVTPATANDLIITAVSSDIPGPTCSVDSSFTLSGATLQGPVLMMAAAYKIKSADSSAENPGWTESSSQNADASAVAIFFK